MNQDSQSSLSFKLKMLRLESGKSQERLAKELGISRSCLANYETGNRQPDNDMLVKIADVFHVMTDFLMNKTTLRRLNLSDSEMQSLVNQKSILEDCGKRLNLSLLSADGRMAVMRYFHYIEASLRSKKDSSFSS